MPNPETKNRKMQAMKEGSEMADEETKTVRRRKKKTTVKKTAAKKKSAAKKTTAKGNGSAKATARSKRASARETGKVDRLESEAAEASELQSLIKGGMTITEAALEAGISRPRARRLVAKASVKPKDRIVGTDEEIGAQIVDLVDNEGMKLVPDMVARTGMSPGKVRRMYREAGGSGLRSGRPAKGNGAAKKTAAKGTSKKASAKAKSAAPRERKSAGKKLTAAERKEARKARAQERRAARREQTNKMRDELWDLDTPVKRIKEIMEDRIVTIAYEINGRPMKPRDLKVSKVVKVEDGKGNEGGKVVFFTDADQRHHTVNFRNISDVRAV